MVAPSATMFFDQYALQVTMTLDKKQAIAATVSTVTTSVITTGLSLIHIYMFCSAKVGSDSIRMRP